MSTSILPEASENKNKNPLVTDDKRLDMVEDSKRNAYLWLFVSVSFFLISVVLGLFTYQTMKNSEAEGLSPLKQLSLQLSSDNGVENRSGLKPRLIDGVYVEEGLENLYPLALMFDNHSDARPHVGLSKANLVFEAEAEGGVTRYLAVFAGSESIEKIGPIRSARPYFIDWARELSSLYAHVGGSPEALAYMKKENVLHINEFYNGEYFWRDEARPRPHNVFTSTEKLRAYLAKKELSEGKFLAWQYKEEAAAENRGAVNKISIPFRVAGYQVAWEYDADANAYDRYLAGKIHQDSDGQTIVAKNVIIEVVEAKVLDEALRLRLDNIGQGPAVLCLDGFCHEATWQKNSAVARTRYFDAAGAELKLNPGTTWVEVVRPDIEYTYE